MATAILDTSALIAAIQDEPGQAIVNALLVGRPLVCTVNLAELSSVLTRGGMAQQQTRTSIAAITVTWVAAGIDLAIRAGELVTLTKPFGLSLGDRFCLALAMRENLPVYTADRIWTRIAAPLGLTVILIR